MNNELNKIIKTFKGNVLAIGIDEKLSKKIDINENIIKCDILNYIANKKEKKIAKQKKVKTIDIKKLRKIYKKKKIDYIICEYSQIEKYLNTFVKDSVYINSSKLYFYGKINKELLLKKYRRYTDKINITTKKDEYIIEIDNTDTKNNKIKEFGFSVVDKVNSLIEIIGDILMG